MREMPCRLNRRRQAHPGGRKIPGRAEDKGPAPGPVHDPARRSYSRRLPAHDGGNRLVRDHHVRPYSPETRLRFKRAPEGRTPAGMALHDRAPDHRSAPHDRPDAASAATYYVSPGGSDSNSGSQSSPWKTIQKAANTVSAGDTVIVNAGTYTERVTVSRSGSSSSYISIRANGTVDMKGFTLTGSYIRVSGFRIDQPSWNGFYISGNSNIVEYNEVSRSIYNGDDADGIRFFGDGHIIRRSEEHDIRQDAIADAHTDCFQTYDNSGTPSTNILIEGNYW